MTADIAARFAQETAEHRMTVLHDDGLYRHLRFRADANQFYWFDLITVPGTLIFQGDGTSYTFRRVEDMFEFFRGHRVNPQYWAEKLTSCQREDVRKFDHELFERRVKEEFVDAARFGGVPAGTGRALRSQVLDEVGYGDERGAYEALARFNHDGFQFGHVWERDFRDYDWWFLWSCHAIVWGIAQYDAWKAPLPEELFT